MTLIGLRYDDDYGLYNVKPIQEDGKPTGNDGPIVTAYGDKLQLPIDKEKIAVYSSELARNPGSNIPIERLPGKKEPPISRDTILGWYWLGIITIHDLLKANWNFSPYPIPRFNLLELLVSLFLLVSTRVLMFVNNYIPFVHKFKPETEAKIRKYAHRNAIWQDGGMPQLWRFAFGVPIQDRAYYLEDNNMEVPWFYRAWTWISQKVSRKSDSSQLIEWRKGNVKLDIEVFKRYFKPEHIYVRQIEYVTKIG